MKIYGKIKKLRRIIISGLLVLCMTLTVASFTYARYYDDDYPEIYSAYWEDRTARWDANGYVTKFELRLYRNGRQVVTKTTTQDSMYLGQYLSNSGDYYFDVRPYNRYTGWGNWMGSDSAYLGGVCYDDYRDRYYDDRCYDDRYYRDRYYSDKINDERYYDRNRYRSNVYSNDISYARNQGPTSGPTTSANPGPVQNQPNVTMPGSGTSNKQNVYNLGVSGQQIQAQQNLANNITLYNKQTITVPEPMVLSQQANGQSSGGKFVESYGVWHFIFDNGLPATNVWVQYKNNWYYIDMSGIMVTGLYSINGKTYFLQSDGSMGVGTFVLDGTTHYFDNNGVMIY